jgi:hypothetical protein
MSATDHTFGLHQILKKKRECKEEVHQLFIDFENFYDSLGKEVLHNILREIGIHMKLLRLTKMCLNENYSRVRVEKHLSDMFPIRNGLKQDVLLPLLFIFALEHAIKRVQVNQDGLKLNGTHQLVVYADDIYLAEAYII